ALLLREVDERQRALARGMARRLEQRAQQIHRGRLPVTHRAERLQRQRTHVEQLAARLASAASRPVRDARARFALAQLR
ncbi:exodeoxyribonuclease VII large subunit, partial [Burkholderia cenocepacia]|nr:exodeoxyribonuclease VII large subunit [Burkholderia cenocepacia]